MVIHLHPKLENLYQLIIQLPTPRNRDEMLCFAAATLKRLMARPVRILFYLDDAAPETKPEALLPCPVRRLDSQVYLCDGDDHSLYFRLEVGQPVWTPIRLASRQFGYLFVDILEPPLDSLEQNFIPLSAARLAHDLNQLAMRQSLEHRPAETGLPITFQQETGCIQIGEQYLSLVPAQMSVLHTLYRQQGQTCSRELLQTLAFPEENEALPGRDRRFNQFMHRLRLKLAQLPGQPYAIETIRDFGYRLAARPDPLNPPSVKAKEIIGLVMSF